MSNVQTTHPVIKPRKSRSKTSEDHNIQNQNTPSLLSKENNSDSNNDNALFMVVLNNKASNPLQKSEKRDEMSSSAADSPVTSNKFQDFFLRKSQSQGHHLAAKKYESDDDDSTKNLDIVTKKVNISRGKNNPNYKSQSSISSGITKPAVESSINVNNMVLRGIFQFEGISIDLELDQYILSFNPINGKF
jgi:hypothetical protein